MSDYDEPQWATEALGEYAALTEARHNYPDVRPGARPTPLITPADLAARLNATAPTREPVYGMCLSCRSVEVEIFDVIGTRDLSHIGEHPRYPVGYGCEVCA